jgi:hypothetical protein
MRRVTGHEEPRGVGSVALLRTNRPFRGLWAARTVSYFGDSLSLVALMLHVAQTSGQALAVSCSSRRCLRASSVVCLAPCTVPSALLPKLSYLAGSVLLDITGPRITFVIAGAGGLLVTVATAIALRRAH